MQALGNFITDDDTIDCRLFKPDPVNASPAARGPQDDGERTLGALLHEVETTGTFIASAASVVNYAVRHPHRAQLLFTRLPVWLPSPPPLIKGGSELLIQAGLPLAIINRLHSLRIHLGIAGEATRQHCAGVATLRPADPSAVDDLVSLWRGLAESTIELLHELRARVPAGPEAATAASRERLLTAAALGAWPCVAETGLIEIPGWLERRSEGRHRLRLACTLLLEGRAWPAHTIDISRFGTGLGGLPEVTVGTRGVLTIGSLAQMTGSIAWCGGDKGGFRFDQPLASVADLARDLT
jgi:hypothetical protein